MSQEKSRIEKWIDILTFASTGYGFVKELFSDCLNLVDEIKDYFWPSTKKIEESKPKKELGEKVYEN